ncbi:TPA: viroplasmin family protein [Pseudomonas aeruginosa]|nr:viroplasmin family protein [Pseudomonas aeruginosa]
MVKKFYVVWRGRKTGIFTDWASCERQTKGFKGAKFKSFETLAEAEKAFQTPLSQATTAKRPNQPKPSANQPKAKLTKLAVAPAPQQLPAEVCIYADGACQGNPGQAGSGLAIYRKDELCELWFGLYDPYATNNTAELKAFHHALLAARDELAHHPAVTIRTDSEYVINSITKWAPRWERAKWMDGSKPRKNAEIIKPIHQLYQELKGRLSIQHVRGHQGIEGNELADRMAALAIENQEPELRRYSGQLDIAEILAFAAG